MEKENKNQEVKSYIKRVDELLIKLSKDKRIDNLRALKERLIKNWAYYYSITGFIGGEYFNIYIWEHKETERKRCSVCENSDFRAADEIIKIVSELSDIELDQKKYP